MINAPERQNNRKIVAMDDTLADPPPASPALLVGRLLDGRYAVTARIAHGGMATVYQATDTRLDRQVALKVMHAELARDEEFVRRFIGEAKSVARLSHQNVVAVFDQGSDGSFLYLAMEYVPGRTLKEVLRDSGRFSPATALEIMTGVLDGLAAAHASGIVHRDIKPENVLLTADGRIKVADFGLARAQSAAGHTRAGLLIGTVSYVPPEQVTGGSTGPGGDVYSAGVMLFELLTGRLPFTGDTPLSVAYQHVNSGVPAPSALVPGIPAAVDQLVLAATSRDPARRPADAGEFLRAVRQVRQGLAQSSWPESSGLTGVMGAGVQGLAEAPWLDLDTPAATNGWWARGAAATSVTGPGTGAFNATPTGNGQFGMGQFGIVGVGQFHGGGREDSHTLVVDRGNGDRYHGGREPVLGRWLFSPRLLIVVVIIGLGVGIGVGGWWLTSGRFVQVPSVSGASLTQVTAVLTADGFTVKRGRVHSNVVASGSVVGTSPAGRVSKGATITILVSSGPFTSVVPKVQNDPLAAAQAALRRVHLVSTTPAGRLERSGRHGDRHQPARGHDLAADQDGYDPGRGGATTAGFRRDELPGGAAVGESARREPAAAAGQQQPAAPGHHHRPGARRHDVGPAGPDRGRQRVHGSPGSRRPGRERRLGGTGHPDSAGGWLPGPGEQVRPVRQGV